MFFSKSETLKFITNKLLFSNVLPLISFDFDNYKNNRKKIITKIQSHFSESRLIVRSSSMEEDTELTSNAGHFESVLNVNKSNSDELEFAINKVFDSMGIEAKNEVFIQPMLEKMKYCGVGFTSDIDTLAPYYVINIDETGSPDAVTSGRQGEYQTYIHLKKNGPTHNNNIIQKLIDSFFELEHIFNCPHLDIEFGIDSNDNVFIFQVRPIVTKGKKNNYKLDLYNKLKRVEKKVEKLSTNHPNLFGKKAIYGVMPDWNPAEIIGIKPNRLALSLYKEFITDEIWAYQRDNYGYRNLRSHPLLISFLGTPYIDIRVDFNSFIPKSLNDELSEKLVEHYLDKLIKNPNFHDKIEFEIVHSCYHFNIKNKLNELLENGFNSQELLVIENSLLDLTNKIIDKDFGYFKSDLKKIELLVDKKESILKSELSTVDKIYWLTEYCKRYGTLPFAGIARAAFISTQMLRSLVDLDVLNHEEYSRFLKSINTITSQMELDVQSLKKGILSKEDFLSIYGHLRPGTYNLLSPRYDEQFDYYFSVIEESSSNTTKFRFNEIQKKRIEKLLIESDLNVNFEQLISFITDSIEGREYSKFIFTSCISEILKLVEELGNSSDVSKNQMIHVDYKSILNLYNELSNQSNKDVFVDDINKYQELNKYTEAVRLPSLITSPQDVLSFKLQKGEPNFITLNKIVNEVVLEEDLLTKPLANKIVFIKAADPGYDYLFSRKIGGLVTEYGGANSHMAVRSAELGIPAVIGAGENNFNNWSNAKVLEIDAKNKLVNIIS